ncbi:MAG: hypothetical protein U0326_12195 [Polyangiales bacterium]
MTRRFALASFALISCSWVACSDDTTPAPAPSPCTDRQQVSLPNCLMTGGDGFSDESCIALDDAIRSNRATVSDARSAAITAPTEMQSVARAAPFTFAWTAPTAMRPRRRPMTVGDELLRWTSLIPEAEAHCAPFTGRAYELRFKVGASVIYRRQQSAMSWTPTAAEWTYLTGAIGAQTAELTIYTASFVTGQISTGAGPFTPMAARRFTVAP